MFAKLTQAQASFLKTIRSMQDAQRKELKRTLFAAVKSTFGIPDDHKLKVEIDNVLSSDYLVIKRSKDGSNATYELDSAGRWTGAAPQQVAEKRWFKVNPDYLDTTVTDDTDWDEGLTGEQLGTHVIANGGNTCISGDSVYILLEEADL